MQVVSLLLTQLILVILNVSFFQTGVKCSWSGHGYLEVDLHHCQHPVNYHVLFKAPEYHVFKNLTLKQGDEQTLYEHQYVTIKIKVTQLERTENIVTSSVSTISVSAKQFSNFYVVYKTCYLFHSSCWN